MDIFESPKTLKEAMNNTGYIADMSLALTIWLAYKLEKCVLVAGPPGTGKTEVAKVISTLINNDDPIRLQCYEGISSDQAIYDWDYRKQLLYIEASKDKNNWNDMEDNLYSDEFLSARPLLKSILSDKKEVLLIDELDKSDEEFEAFLLEFLGEMQVSISESKTIKAKNIPFVIITSNDMRELSDALKRRCLFFYIDYPPLEREVEIIHARVNGVDDMLATQIAKFVSLLRNENLKKIPSISETIDWVRALVKLEIKNLNPKLVKNTLNILLKTKADLDVIEPKIDGFLDKLPKKAIRIEKPIAKNTSIKNTDEILNSEDNWNF